MNRMKYLACAAALMVCWQAMPRTAHGIILYDHWYRNKSAPTGTIANSGWQWEGNWGVFTGTPIAKNYFITASHVGGSVGQSLVLNGVSYPTIATYDDPSSDLRIWKTSKSFSSWAPMYKLQGEVGKTAVLMGRGTARGSDVNVNGSLHGWQWGSADNRLSWGQNKLKGVVNGGSGLGDMISFSFDRSGRGDYVSNEGIVSGGDSSGAVFVNSYGTWKLAGLLYSVETPYKTSAGGGSFNAAVFDKGGLYYNGSLVFDGSTDAPATGYATRLTAHQSWISGVLNGSIAASAAAAPTGAVVPEPAAATLLGAACGLIALRRRRRRSE